MRRFLNQWTKTFFPTFRKHFEALNATICWSVLCKLLTIEKYGVSAFTGKKNLMSSDQNSLRTKEMKFWTFLLFRKKNPFFSNFENPLKKTAPRAVFFEKMIQFQNGLKSFSEISEGIVRKLRLHSEQFWDFKCNDSIICKIVAFRSQEKPILSLKAQDFVLWKLKIVAFKDERCNYQSEVWNT